MTDPRDTIIGWYRRHGRDLPMRGDDVSAWGTLVFEVMSQQTPLKRVQPVWERWMKLWPTPALLAASSPAEVLVEWDHLGYPSRALRLRDCAIVISENWDGTLPDSYDDLLNLPGVGPYTASAVASFHFHHNVSVLDTNIRRVIGRIWNGVEAPTSASPTREERKQADALLPGDGKATAEWNVAVMEFGALLCTAKNPSCDACPIIDSCAWAQAEFPSAPVRRPSQKWTGTDRQARGRVLAALRDLNRDLDKHSADLGTQKNDATTRPVLTMQEALQVATLPGADPTQAKRVISALLQDGLIDTENDLIFLPQP